MIQGAGIDIVEVDRIAEKLFKDTGFKELVFSPDEIDYCEKMINKFEHYAVRFAAKEAFFKALGTGWSEQASFNEVEIFHEETGKPCLRLLGKTNELRSSFNITKILVSLSHIKSMATAIVIIEK